MKPLLNGATLDMRVAMNAPDRDALPSFVAQVQRQRRSQTAASRAATVVLEGALAAFAVGEADMRSHVDGAMLAKHQLMAVVSELQVRREGTCRTCEV